MRIYSIYKATNIKNGKCYIGFDSNWPARQKEHKRDAVGSDLIFHKAIRKHGWDNFTWEVIYQSKDGDHTLNVMESYFISLYCSHVFSPNSNGYNMATGGGGTLGMVHTEATKRKISNSKKGKPSITERCICQYCSSEYSARQLAVHERACIMNPCKVPGYNHGKTNNYSVQRCKFCNVQFKTTGLYKHELTCSNNPDKVKLIYKTYNQPITTCEHCGKHGGIGLMKRYHHDNCKLKN